MAIKTGLIGYGYWGPLLLRNFMANRNFRVVAVADSLEDKRKELREHFPALALYAEGNELIDSPEIEAVVVATPVRTHYAFSARALSRGKHVLVEKPLSGSVAEGEELLAIAERKNVTLMVDHTFLFTGAVQSIRKLYSEGELGRISYYDSIRVNLGLFQPDVNVLWDLAPHDLSIVDYLLEEEPLDVEASGYCHVNESMPDIVYLTLHYPSKVIAHLNLSWMSPVKVRRVAIGGLKKMLVWDDLNKEEKIKIYNSGIDFRQPGERETVIPGYRIGDIYSPRVSEREALSGVVDHFHRVITGKEASILSGERGLRVVRSLEKAQQALEKKGMPSRAP